MRRGRCTEGRSQPREGGSGGPGASEGGETGASQAQTVQAAVLSCPTSWEAERSRSLARVLYRLKPADARNNK